MDVILLRDPTPARGQVLGQEEREGREGRETGGQADSGEEDEKAVAGESPTGSG